MEVVKTVTPKDESHWLALRAENINSTEVAALFGVSPYLTHFELWHRKKNAEIVSIVDNERMKWGIRLESAIARGIAEDQGWKIQPMKDYYFLADKRLGASFDYEIVPDGFLEVKNVDSLAFKNGWLLDDEHVDIPIHIEMQVQHQLAVCKKPYAYIGALVGGNKVVLCKREPDPIVARGIETKVANFWESIEANKPPEPDLKRDVDFISKLYKYAEPGKVLDVSQDKAVIQLCQDHKHLSDHIKALEETKDAIKAQLLMRIGDAEKVLGEGFSISAGVIGPAHIAYERKPYRNFKLFWKKEKKK